MSRAAVVFDLDGTLLNTLGDLAAACNHALTTHGFPTHPVNAYRQFVGNGAAMLVQRIVPALQRQNEPVLASVRSCFDQYYQAHSRDLTQPYTGIPELLETLQVRKIKMAVLSNKPHDFTCALTEHFFPGVFQLVWGNRSGFPVKPDPSLTGALLEALDLSPAQTLYLGDSGVDMQTGRQAGFLTLGALWGFREAPELLENGADALIDSPAQLLDFL